MTTSNPVLLQEPARPAPEAVPARPALEAMKERGAAPRSPSRPGRLATFVVAALIAGLAVGRFLTASPTQPAAPPAPTARSLTERVADLEDRVERDPGGVPAWRQLASLYILRAGSSGDPSFYRLAQQALDRAGQLLPDDPQVAVGRGMLSLARHDFAEGLRQGESALARLPRNPDALAVVVDADVELGRYDTAVRRLQELLDARPGLPALARASYLRELHGDVDGALQAMLQAVAAATAPFDVATTRTLLGDLRFGHGDVTGARSEYERALADSADLPRAQVGRARCMAAAGDVAGGIGELERLVDRFPLPEALVLLSDLQLRAGRPDRARDAEQLVRSIADLQRESGQVPDLEMALFEADHGNPAIAVDLARRALSARPTIYASDALAWALLRAGQPAAAVPHVEAALRLGTRDAALHYHAAVVFAAVDEDDRARSELRTAVDINPWFSFRHLGDVAALAQRLGVPPPPERSSS